MPWLFDSKNTEWKAWTEEAKGAQYGSVQAPGGPRQKGSKGVAVHGAALATMPAPLQRRILGLASSLGLGS